MQYNFYILYCSIVILRPLPQNGTEQQDLIPINIYNVKIMLINIIYGKKLQKFRIHYVSQISQYDVQVHPNIIE